METDILPAADVPAYGLGSLRNSLGCGIVQDFKSAVSEAIAAGAAELGAERQHGAEHFSKRRNVIVGNPAAEIEELIVENRRGVQNCRYVLGCDLRLSVVQRNDNAW